MPSSSLLRVAPILGVAAALTLSAGASAAPITSASIPGDPILTEDGGSIAQPQTEHHGGIGGHLPPTQSNVDLISRLELTWPDAAGNPQPVVPEQITDVSVHKNAAYIGSWRVPLTWLAPVPEAERTPCPRGGFWTVDISDPRNPRQLTFVRALPGNYHTEGVHAMSMSTPSFTGDILAVSNEFCVPSTQNNGIPASGGGFDLFDVSNPANPVPLARGVGDRGSEEPDPDGAGPAGDQDTLTGDRGAAHQAHSVYMWKAGRRAFAVVMDNEEEHDVDIFEITDPRNPQPVRGYDFDDGTGFAGVNDETPLGVAPGLHDMVVKEINGRQIMLASYWDAGYVTVDVTDPANARLVADSTFGERDKIFGTDPPEGNAHEAEFSWDNKYIVAADEDFDPRPLFAEITGGPNEGLQFGGVIPSTGPELGVDGNIEGDTRFVGQACTVASIPAPSPGVTVAVVERGNCDFIVKLQNVDTAGYDAMIVFNSTAAGTGCEGRINMTLTGYTGDVIPLFVTRQTGLLLLDAHPGETYTCVAGDPAASTPTPAAPREGSPVRIGVFFFDGWGYARLFRNTTGELEELDQFAIEESMLERYATGFGDLSIHEVATDPTEYLAYSSYYSGGLRVLRFGDDGLDEVARYIGPDGNNFWGIEQFTASEEWFSGFQEERLIAASDRDYGLYLFRYTGPGAAKPPTCSDQTVLVPFKGSVTVPLTCTDPNGNAITRSVLSGVSNGTLSTVNQQAGTVTYTHTGASLGMADRFGFRAADAAARSNRATATIVAVPANVPRCGNPFAGTAAADNIAGSAFGDTIRAGGGNDVVQGRALHDCLFGEAGRDMLWGQLGRDTLDGGAGKDRIWGDSNRDTLYGRAGDDRLAGGTGNDRLLGGDGDDRVEGAAHSDRLLGGDGDDRITGGSGNDRMDGGAGRDVLTGGPGRNRFSGGAGADNIRAVNERRDTIACGAGVDDVEAERRDRVARDCERVSFARVTRR